MRRLAGLGFVAASAAVLHGQVSVLTWHNDAARTGQNLQETILTPATVSSGAFQRLFVIGVDGKVDAQPLYVPSVTIPGKGSHNTLYVMTEHDSAYAFDADSGVQLWHVSLTVGTETSSDDRGCSQVTPEIGITATPAIDLQMGPHGAMYVIAMSKTTSGTYHQRLHALDVTTGAELFGGPVEIQATYPGSGAEGSGTTLTFSAAQHKERAALITLSNVVYTAWSSHCDNGPYTGWVIGYNEGTLAQVSVLNLTPNGSDGGIWAAGSGPAADSLGNLYLLMGNGTFDTTLNAARMPANGDYGNGFVRLSTSAGLAVADYFTMSNTVSESGADTDLGSGGAMVLPPLTDGNGRSRSLAVGAGKDGHIYVVDRTNMGKFVPGMNAIYEDLPTALSGGVYSSPAWFNGSLYYGAVGDHLKEFGFSGGTFPASPVSSSPSSFGYPGTTPSISASGTSNGIVWAAENTNPAVLHAYDATNLSTELYNSNTAANGRDHFGTGNKFIVPTVVNGKVYVATTSGVGVFGLVGATASLSIAKTSVGTFTQGETGATYSVTVSNGASAGPTSGTVTVTETVPPGLTLVSMNGGATWNCAVLPTCTTSNVLNGGASYPAITVTVNVSPNAPLQLTNQVSVSGGGSATSNASVTTTIMAGLTGDFDGNGHPDLVWQNTNGSAVVWYLGGTDGSAYLGGSNLAGTSSGWRIVAVADLDGNGHADLIWQFTDGSVVVWYMGGTNGSTYQSSKLLAGPSSGWRVAAVADLNGDGHPDVIWQGSDGSVVVWYMGGTDGSTYQSSEFLAGPSSGWRIEAAADFDGNGHPDLIWQFTDGTVVVWYMGGTDGSAYQSSTLLAGSSSGWRLAGAADLTGNGPQDLIWQGADGSVVVWYMGGTNGSTYQSSKFLAGGSTGWLVAAM